MKNIIKGKLSNAGKEKSWVKSSGTPLNISAQEWGIARTIMQKMIAENKRFPIKVDKNEYQQQFPELKHSFVITNTENGPRCGFISKGKDANEGVLGYGSKGVVKIVQWQDGSQSVLKIQSEDKRVTDKEFLKDIPGYYGIFVRERPSATPWIKLKGKVPNIKNKQYSIVDKISGTELGDFLKRNKIDSFAPAKKLDLAIALTNAVGTFHSKNIIHADIKLGNIMINDNMQPKLIDFDTAIKLNANQTTIHLGKPVGSRNYMAPEVGVWKGSKNLGFWASREGNVSLASDIYSLGCVFEKCKLHKIPAMAKLIQRMKAHHPKDRPNYMTVMNEIQKIKSAFNNQAQLPTTISIGQALLILIKHYENTNQQYSETLKKLYTIGFNTAQDNVILEQIKKDPLLAKYNISDNYQTISDDASRRYFETHLSFETMKEAIQNYPVDAIQSYYDSIKSCFKDLGGDLDFQKFKKTGERKLRRDYAKEAIDRANLNLDPNDLIPGISREEQIQMDRLFSGNLPGPNEKSFDDPMYMEYADMIHRIKNSPYLNEQDKQKALLIVKSTRLSIILGNKMEKYKDKGTYSGDLMPGQYISDSEIYKPENRGRIPRTDGDKAIGTHNMGLILADMPLDPSDEAYASEPFIYKKPSENSTFIADANWVKYAMDKKVHTFSNSISGTLLAQLRMMIKLHQENKLTFKNKEDFANHFRSMISLMTYVSGGHSLVEFTAPLQLKDIIEEFKFVPGFSDINLESLFYSNNQQALDKALEKTQKYNENYVNLSKEKQDGRLSGAQKIDEKAILNQFKKNAKLKGDNGAQINTKLNDYSHLNPENVRQKMGTVALMEEASKKELSELVTFKPQRALLHEVSAFVTSFIKTENEDHRNEIIKTIVNTLSTNKAVMNLGKKCNDIYTKTKREINKTLLTGVGKQVYIDAINAAKRITFPCAYCNEIDTAEKLAVELAATQLMNEMQEKRLYDVVSAYFRANPFYQYKSAALDAKPVVMFAAGGQGSGKGTAIANMLNHAENQGIDPRNFVYLNTDSYKSLLKNTSMDQKLYSQLTHQEAKMIRDKANDYAKKHKMHILLDQVSPSASVMKYAQDNNGVVKGVFISTKVEEAIERSFKRGQETGRFEDTQSILECHKDMVKKAQDYVLKNLGKKMQLEFLDNSNANNGKSELFLTVDCLNKTLVIENREMLKQFIKKQCINKEAKKYCELYAINKIADVQLEKLTQAWIKKMENAGLKVSIKNNLRTPANDVASIPVPLPQQSRTVLFQQALAKNDQIIAPKNAKEAHLAAKAIARKLGR